MRQGVAVVGRRRRRRSCVLWSEGLAVRLELVGASSERYWMEGCGDVGNGLVFLKYAYL